MQSAETKGVRQARNIDAGSYEVDTILTAIREAYEKAINSGSENFSWNDVCQFLKISDYHGWYWFRVMLYGRNAEKEAVDGPINAYPESTAVDDTGDFISVNEGTQITHENFRDACLTITKKTREIIYR